MGRPINKKFFGNINPSHYNDIAGGITGVGGEGIVSVDFTERKVGFNFDWVTLICRICF